MVAADEFAANAGNISVDNLALLQIRSHFLFWEAIIYLDYINKFKDIAQVKEAANMAKETSKP